MNCKNGKNQEEVVKNWIVCSFKLNDFSTNHVSEHDETISFFLEIFEILFKSGIDEFKDSFLVNSSAHSPSHFSPFAFFVWKEPSNWLNGRKVLKMSTFFALNKELFHFKFLFQQVQAGFMVLNFGLNRYHLPFDL